MSAAFGRLCVETQPFGRRRPNVFQPPSGGCVLKLPKLTRLPVAVVAAAFGRLCVETRNYAPLPITTMQPPSGGCVLKLSWNLTAC